MFFSYFANAQQISWNMVVIGKMFGSRHPPAPKIFFRVFENFGAEGRAFLKWLRNVLDDADVTHIFKEARFYRLRGIAITTGDRWNQKKKKTKTKTKTVKINSIIIKSGGNEQIIYYAPEIPQFFSCYD